MSNIIVKRIAGFIKKFYLNKILKGIFILGILFILLLIAFSTIEYYGWLGKTGRAILFYSFVLSNVVVLFYYILIPIFKLVGLSNGISMMEAANIIGKHFSQINDKLVNLLQLQNQSKEADLIIAAINQKEKQLSPFRFVLAIDKKESRKYLKYLVPSIIAIGLILVINPNLISEPAGRITKYNEEFKKPAPFDFIVENKSLDVVEQEDLTITITTDGDEMPADISIVTGEISYKATKKDKNLWEYTFKNVRNNKEFVITAGEVSSIPYLIKVVPKPTVKNFIVDVNYPEYIGKKDETIENIGDLIVPRGTYLTWKISGKNCSNLVFKLNEKPVNVKKDNVGRFIIETRCFNNIDYTIKTVNSYIDTNKPISYNIQVVEDKYPLINVKEMRDSLNDFMLFFSGEIGDDYGFTKLSFYYAKIDDGDTSKWNTELLTIQKNKSKQRFFHYIDLKNYQMTSGQQLIYYFKITDNDGVSGPKSTKSVLLQYRLSDKDEMEAESDKAEKNIKKNIEEAINKAKELDKNIDKLNDELKGKKNLDWQEKEKIEQLINQHKNLKEEIENVMQQNEYKKYKENQFLELNEELLQKQQQLQEMMKELLDEETLKLLQELQEMMEEINKDDVEKMMEKMKLNTNELEMELDRSLEMFKQLELEKDLEEVTDKLDELAKKQDELAEDSKEKANDTENLKKEQDKLNKEFEKIQEKIDEIEKKNKELEYPNDLDNTDQQQGDIQQDMENSSSQLQNNKRKNASKSQRSAAQKMKQLSQQMQMNLEQMQQEQNAEDIDALRQILENLIQISFDQENLINETDVTSRTNPKFPELINKQNKILDNFSIIEDSLIALSKRQAAIKNIVHKEIATIKANMSKVIDNLLAMNTVGAVNSKGKANAMERQQLAMTSINNLSLLLAESLDKMMQEMQNQMQGKGKACKNPKNSGQSMQQIRKMQDGLNKQLQKMKKQMEQGKSPGENGRNTMSEQFARMAAQQEAIRKALQQYMDNLQNQDGNGKGNLGDLLREMEKTEEELVNKIINNQTLKRQAEIHTRMLESERAEQQREQEKKRQSNEAINTIFSNPKLFLEYNRIKEKEVEMLQFSSPALNQFYKNIVNDFLLKLEA